MLSLKAWLFAGYRLFQRQILKKVLFPKRDFPHVQAQPKNSNRIWFHAASVGELECLWPIIVKTARETELIVTIFSESAASALKKLESTLSEISVKPVLFSGYSPWEGEWKEALKKLQPRFFVTAKYEAWPDLWISLAQLEIPLAIVAARPRSSLKLAKSVCQFFLGRLPSLLLLSCNEGDQTGLKTLFPKAVVEIAGEPRWERVFLRATHKSPKVERLVEYCRELKRPWGVIGSAWLEDLKLFGAELGRFDGTLWVIPHRVDPPAIEEIQRYLDSQGVTRIKSSSLEGPISSQSALPKCILVDEMGFLSELYTLADWAFVGGGFGKGVHSTIEPAIHGIPIAAGPKGAEKFSEIQELTLSGQLQILRTHEDLQRWLNKMNHGVLQKQKEEWRKDALSRSGATQKILTAVENFI